MTTGACARCNVTTLTEERLCPACVELEEQFIALMASFRAQINSPWMEPAVRDTLNTLADLLGVMWHRAPH